MVKSLCFGTCAGMGVEVLTSVAEQPCTHILRSFDTLCTLLSMVYRTFAGIRDMRTSILLSSVLYYLYS